MSTTFEGLVRQNFLEYASYVIVDRAIPDLRDGLKPVQRRILQILHEVDDGRLHKAQSVVGDTMKLHPHGDASIAAALVVLANKEYFIEKQGNWGSVVTGHPAAAARYIECRLTPLARETLFHKALTEYVPSYDGRKDEMVAVPAKLPMTLLLGGEGIAVGLATKILPHNFCELLEAQIDILDGGAPTVDPDFQQGGIMDASEYDDGRGRVKVRARMETRGRKGIVITEVPYGVTTESLIASIEAAAQKGQLKIGRIDDFTTEQAEIHIEPARGVTADETIPQLYAYTQCEVSLSSNITVIRDRRPVSLTVSEALVEATRRLKDLLKRELLHDLGLLEDRQHWLTLERIFIENRVYKQIEEAKTAEAVRTAVWDGMHAFEDQFFRPMVDEDVKRLLEIRIRRISAYDIERSREEVETLQRDIKTVTRKLKNMKQTTKAWLTDILDRYGPDWPRRTDKETFTTVDRKAVARANIRVTYDPESGYFGSAVKSGSFTADMSSYDRVLAIAKDGTYRVLGPEEKVLLPRKLLYIQAFDPEQGAAFLVVYRTKEKIAYGKRIHIQKHIKGREYKLIPFDDGGKVDLLLPDRAGGEDGDLFATGAHGTLHMHFVPKARARIKEAEYDLDTLKVTGVGARGMRLNARPVARVKRIKKR